MLQPRTGIAIRPNVPLFQLIGRWRTEMRKLTLSFFALMLAFTASVITSCASSEEKPIQHLRIADIISMEEAKKTFIDKTSEMRNKKTLNAEELHQIHMLTYPLEKSVAYFVENLTDNKRQKLAQEIAVIVEDIHLDSENNRKEKTQQHLTEYFILAKDFIYGF
jgi:hypothetical protein